MLIQAGEPLDTVKGKLGTMISKQVKMGRCMGTSLVRCLETGNHRRTPLYKGVFGIFRGCWLGVEKKMLRVEG